MQYQSTRDKNLKASSAQAILNGLAPDGGLYTMPSFDEVKFDYTTVLNMDTMSMSTKSCTSSSMRWSGLSAVSPCNCMR